jgi:hypothetical protein
MTPSLLLTTFQIPRGLALLHSEVGCINERAHMTGSVECRIGLAIATRSAT